MCHVRRQASTNTHHSIHLLSLSSLRVGGSVFPIPSGRPCTSCYYPCSPGQLGTSESLLHSVTSWIYRRHELHARGSRFVFRANGGQKLGVSLSKEVPCRSDQPLVFLASSLGLNHSVSVGYVGRGADLPSGELQVFLTTLRHGGRVFGRLAVQRVLPLDVPALGERGAV